MPSPIAPNAPSVDHAPDVTLILFHLAGSVAALPMDSVERIVPMAELVHPLGLPAAIEGVLNLSGAAVPVLRLDRLLRLPEAQFGLYSMLVVLRGERGPRAAILVDRVTDVFSTPAGSLLPVSPGDSFNGVSQSAAMRDEFPVPILSPDRILARKEREALAEFQQLAQSRLEAWEKP